MKAEIAAMLEAATGWTGPVRLAYWRRGSKRKRTFLLERPFGIVGHAEQCDLVLKKPGASYRHAYLQVIGGQLLVVDCGTDRGLLWEDGRKRAYWLVPGRTVELGDYALRLAPEADSPAAPPASFPLDFNPLKSYQNQLGPLPPWEFEFLNAQIKKMVITLGHMVTMVGRHRSCKFHFDDESVSLAHASLLCTPSGLWVIDLLGREGTRVNDVPVRFALIENGDQLQIGRYRMRVRSASLPADSVMHEDDAKHPVRESSASTVLVSSNKVFIVEQSQRTLVVTPEATPQQFRYAEVHHEANRILNLIEDPDINSLLVDLHRDTIFTSISIGVFNRLRNAISVRGGRVALCCVAEPMQEVLKEMGLYGLWQHFATRDEALRALAD